MDLIQEGQKISISFQKEGNFVEIFCIIAKVLEDRLIIDLPQYFMRYIEFLEAGKTLTAKVFSKIGTVDFNTIVISSPLEDEFSIEFDEDALKLTEGEEIPVISDILPLKIKKGDFECTVKTFEISTEYLKFYSNKPFEVEESFDCSLILAKDYGTIKFVATVTNRDEVYNNEYTVSYSQMNEYDRQTLLYYMYVYTNDSEQG